MKSYLRLGFVLGLLGGAASGLAAVARIKDMASIKGVRDNQLIGYGLVVGLKGTGDSKKEFTGLSLSQMFRQLGVDIKSDQIESKNAAAVIVTAKLPPFARVGSKVDITVSSVGDAKSLQGGTLLLTPLRGGDKNIYAVAQGPLTMGGFAEGGGGASSGKNHPTVGMIPSGAMVEREVEMDFSNRNAIRLALHNPDFTTASRMAKSINAELGGVFARARDSTTIDVMVPFEYEGGVVDMVAQVERVKVHTDNSARIVINERTGTVVVGNDVKISTVAIAHGNLTLEIKETTTTTDKIPPENATDVANAVKKPIESTTVKETSVKVNESGDKLIHVSEGNTLGDVVRGLNSLGVSPRDLISILQALKSQGALQAELELL